MIDAEFFWIYMLRCSNNTYYTGYTNNLKKRYKSHIDGTGKCKYTKSFKPLEIAQCWKIYDSKAKAMKIEREIKKLSRLEKEKLITIPSLLLDSSIKIVPNIERMRLNEDARHEAAYT